MKTLEHDKTQVTVIGALLLILVVGFIALDLYLLRDGIAFPISTASRCVVAIVSLGGIWVIRRLSSAISFDRIVLVWMIVDTCHLLIVNALGIADYVPVVVWDRTGCASAWTSRIGSEENEASRWDWRDLSDWH